jgi:hypothetical protein
LDNLQSKLFQVLDAGADFAMELFANRFCYITNI